MNRKPLTRPGRPRLANARRLACAARTGACAWIAVGVALIGGCADSNPAPAAATPVTAASAPPPPTAPPTVPMAAPAATMSETPSTAAPVAGPANTPPPAEAAEGSESFAAARALFDSHDCKRCHSLDANANGGFTGGPPSGGPSPEGPPPGGFGQGGPGRGPGGPPRGPNLARVGANPEHTVDWIAEHIRDPKSHNPRSRMPGFADKMSAEEIQQVAEFLASLK